MALAKRDRKCIGRIGGRCVRKPQQDPDHILDLDLVGVAPAHDGLLDLSGGKFEDRQPLVDTRDQRRTPSLTQFQGRVRIAVHKYDLHRHLLRKVFLDNHRDPFEDGLEPHR